MIVGAAGIRGPGAQAELVDSTSRRHSIRTRSLAQTVGAVDRRNAARRRRDGPGRLAHRDLARHAAAHQPAEPRGRRAAVL